METRRIIADHYQPSLPLIKYQSFGGKDNKKGDRTLHYHLAWQRVTSIKLSSIST